jgi:hypothetical protein
MSREGSDPLGGLFGRDMPAQGKKRNRAGGVLGDDPEWSDQSGSSLHGEVMEREMFPAMCIVAGLFLPGKIVGEFKEFVFSRPEPHGGMIRNAKQFERIVVNAALHIFVLDAADFDLAVHALVLGRVGIIREIANRNLDADQLGVINGFLIELRFQLGVCLCFEQSDNQPVTKPVKKKDRYKQGGADGSHDRVTKWLR